jgi:hypothetical protein
MSLRFFPLALLVSASVAFASSGFAQDEKKADPPAEAPAAAPAPASDAPDPAFDPKEKEHTAYRFIGLRFRDVFVPKFMVNIFADGGASVNVFMFGPEFTTRKDRLEFDFALMYGDYSMDPFLFKSKDDPEAGYEIVSSSMKVLYFTVDLLYEVPIDKSGRFSFLVGGGVGLGIVFGNLRRNQAYPNNRNAVDPNDVGAWKPCRAQGNPGVTSTQNGEAFCDDSNPHYGSYDEPSWANGGSKPSVFPWLALPQFSFRYKPIKQLQTRFDLGFSVTGFFFGLSAGYGL